MAFGFPEAFLLLLVVLPPLLWLLVKGERRTRVVAGLFKSTSLGSTRLIWRLALLSLFLFSLAAVGAKPYAKADKTGQFLFLVDVSRSMSARFSCAEPTFLDRSKDVIRTVIARIPQGKFGVFAFDRLAFPITQMTYDHAYLEEAVKHGLFVGLSYEATATEIGNALSVVVGKKERLPEIYGEVEHVILLSDGYVQGDYRRRLRRPLVELQKAGLTVLTVAVGNPGRTPIQVSEGGECREEDVTADGETVTIPVREDILRFISEGTQGAHFEEGQAAELVSYLRTEGLERVDQVDQDVESDQNQRRDLSLVFLVPATAALFGFFALGSGGRLR